MYCKNQELWYCHIFVEPFQYIQEHMEKHIEGNYSRYPQLLKSTAKKSFINVKNRYALKYGLHQCLPLNSSDNISLTDVVMSPFCLKKLSFYCETVKVIYTEQRQSRREEIKHLLDTKLLI